MTWVGARTVAPPGSGPRRAHGRRWRLPAKRYYTVFPVCSGPVGRYARFALRSIRTTILSPRGGSSRTIIIIVTIANRAQHAPTRQPSPPPPSSGVHASRFRGTKVCPSVSITYVFRKIVSRPVYPVCDPSRARVRVPGARCTVE